MAAQKITFSGADGQTLSAQLDLPRTRVQGFVLYAHCFTCSKNFKTTVALTRGLVRQGFGVLRFDFTGLGESEGDFADTNFSSNVEDLLAAADWLRQYHDAPVLLLGHSFGGTAMLAAAGRIPESRAVATIGAPADPGHIKHLLNGAIEDIQQDGGAEVTLAGRSFTIKKQFLDDIEDHRLHDAIRSMDKALLIMHAPTDNLVDIDNARLIYEAARHPKSFVALDGADHFLSDSRDADYAASILATWAGRYLGRPDEAAALEEGQVEVAENNRGRFGNTVRTRNHELLADEPPDNGGEDSGPNPYDYLLAGLGACTSMTLRMYAERKQMNLGPVAVRLKHDRIHARDCVDCPDVSETDGRIDLIERQIILPAGLDEQQREKLLEIANKCPVHKTLTNAKQIRTVLGNDKA
ncbi:MAG: bifunctional alpha/beta hydrolase/OsmC family protein [Gammaproteobacteria bacterium]|nr:bifunctional alpha/beta hydrolase/OsmC family protein [Gammaproteobacteria bacterium]